MKPGVILYEAVRGLARVLFKLVFRLTVEGREHLPTSGPFILAPVHRSNIDFLLVSILPEQRMRYMGKDTIWKYPTLGKIFTAMGAFPVKRGSADREALRRCVEIIENGEPLVLFPEGTRKSGPIVETLFEGAAYIASRTGVPIIPVGIGGSEKAMPKGAKMIRPVKLHIVIGPAIPPPGAGRGEGDRIPRSAVRETTEHLKKEIQVLYDAAQAKAG